MYHNFRRVPNKAVLGLLMSKCSQFRPLIMMISFSIKPLLNFINCYKIFLNLFDLYFMSSNSGTLNKLMSTVNLKLSE